MIMAMVIPTVVDNAVVDILEILPTAKMEEGEEIAGDAGVVAAEILVTTIQVMGEIAMMITTTKREETVILLMDGKNSNHQEADDRAGVDVAEGGEEGEEENNNKSNANDHQHRPWILGQPISLVGTPTRIPCGSNSCDLWN